MTGWGSLMGKDKKDVKRKKEKTKLQQIDMFGNNDSDNSSAGTVSKKKKNEVNPTAIKGELSSVAQSIHILH